MKIAHAVATFALVGLSLVHILLAPVFFDEFVMRVMWYVAQGLMGVFVAFLNIASRRVAWTETTLRTLTHLANLLGLSFVVVYSTVDRSLPSYAGIVVLLVLSTTGFASSLRRPTAHP